MLSRNWSSEVAHADSQTGRMTNVRTVASADRPCFFASHERLPDLDLTLNFTNKTRRVRRREAEIGTLHRMESKVA